MMSDKSIVSTTAGNSTAVASSAWCNGHIIDGQCMLVADAAYSGGEHLDFNLDVMDMAAMEFYNSGGSNRRVLVTGKGIDIRDSLRAQKPVVDARNNKYINNNCNIYNRGCPK